MADHFNLLELIFDHLPLAMFAKDPRDDFKIVHWNRHAEELWQFKKSEAIGKRDEELFSRESAQFFRQMDLETMRRNKTVFIEREVIENSVIGRRWLRTWKIPILHPETGEGLYLLGISQDITELIESENKKEQLEQIMALQREKLAHASRLAALGEMSGGVAHEINSPLGVISLHAEVALSLLDQPNVPMTSLGNHLRKIHDTTFRIAKIVQTMKSVARNNGHDQFEWVSLAGLVDDIVALSQHRIRIEGIVVRKREIPADLMLFCRSVQISQVFLNLLNNAIDAMDGTTERWIGIDCRENEDWFEVRFSDGGSGVPETIRPHLFDTFFTTKSPKEGTGLGLSISKGILQAHEGDLYLESAPGPTTFVLLFPKRRLRRV